MAEIVSSRIKKLQAGPRTLSGNVGGGLNQLSIFATLSPEVAVLPADSDGNVTSYTGAVTTMSIQVGNTVDTVNWNITRTNSAGVLSVLNGATLTITSLTADSAYVDLTATKDGFAPLTKRFALTRVKNGAEGTGGASSIRGDLSNDSHTVSADADGSNPNLAGATTTVIVLNGVADDTANWSCAATPSSGVTGTLSGKTYTVTGFTVDTGHVDFLLTRTGYSNLTLRFTLTKVRAGADGAPAIVYAVEPNVSHIKKTSTGVLMPASITFSAYETIGTNPRGPYAGRFIIEMSTDGANFTPVATSSINETTKTYSPPNTAITVRAKLYKAGGTTNLVDQESVLVVADGLDGDAAGRGEDGQSFWMVTSSSAIGKTKAGTYLPGTLTITAYRGLGITTPSVYGARFIIATTTDGTNYVNQYTSSVDETTKTYTVPSNIKAIRARMYMAGGTSMMVDEEIIPIVSDGADGVTGDWTSYVFKMAVSKPTTPTETTLTIPSGWSDSPPSTGTDPIWMSKAIISGMTGKPASTWSVPIQVTGIKGADGNDGPYEVFQYSKNTSTVTPPTTNWSSSPPTLASGEYAWMRAGTVIPPATSPATWKPAVRVTGEKGADGGTASRGSLNGYGTRYGIYTSSWSDNSTNTNGAQYANAVIYNMLNGTSITSTTAVSHLRIGDTVTLTNSSTPTQAITKYWSGSAWVNPGTVIDGNLLVKGSFSADYVGAGTMTGSTVRTSAGSTRVEMSTASNSFAVWSSGTKIAELGGNTSGVLKLTGGSTLPGLFLSGTGMPTLWVEQASGTAARIFGSSTTQPTVEIHANANVDALFIPSGNAFVAGRMSANTLEGSLNGNFVTGSVALSRGVNAAGGNASVVTGTHGASVQTDGKFVFYKAGSLFWVAPQTESDARLKENIVDTSLSGIDTVNALRVVDYTWRTNSPSFDHGKVHTGFIAQETELVIPDAVQEVADTKMLHKEAIVPALVKAVQELHAELLQVKVDLAALQNNGGV